MSIEFKLKERKVIKNYLSIYNKSDVTKLIQVKSSDRLLKILLLQKNESVDLILDKENLKNILVEEIKENE